MHPHTIPVSRILEKVDGLFDKNQAPEAGRVLVYWRDEAIALGDKRGELALENELVGYYRKQNDCTHGLQSVARALTLVEELQQGDLASGATIFLNCATAYKAFDRAADALPLYARAEAIYKQTLSETDARFGGLYNNMALALVDMGRFAEAETAYQKALAVMGTVPGGAAESAITYINLAHLYEAWGKPTAIPACLEQAYALLQSDTLVHNGYYAFVLEKCAPSFGYFGNTEAYETFKKEADRIYAGT